MTAMKSSKSENINIEHVAKLSKLNLNASEIKIFTKQLGEVINYINELAEIDTESVEPTSQTTGLINKKRKDIRRPSLTQNDAISQSGNVYNGYFKVGMILENKEM
ncbi:MAG TPA: Asp-tRNA(Asn)/Glu-tRNA(Gln) amidotransferase subunit GatC [Patescibacteria group bacterium]|nr:Asp-tRNA(Asn)/Glu-tRNA(Gln) amidotransferase subunit GatC [Patescibacteria group bacterium]